MAKVELKQPVVQAIVNDIEGAQSIVLVDYRGLTVAEDTALRKQLREAGVVYKVCKNTMMKRAFEGTDFAQLDEYDAAALTELAKIPSREELLSRLLGSMQSPITNLARVLNQIAEKGGAAECTPATEEAPAEAAAETPATEE